MAKKKPDGPPKPVGRPKIELNADQVLELAKLQCTYKEMAAFFSCSVDTLERNFADIIDKGKELGKTSLRRAQFRAALGGNVTMQIWLGKQMLGQSEKIEQKTLEVQADKKATPEQIARLKAMLKEDV